MNTPKILVTHRVHDEVAARLARYGRVEMNDGAEPWSYPEVVRRATDAAAMMTFMTERVDAALVAAAPELKIIACALKGYDSYDVAACAEARVWLSIVPDLLTEPTAELAIGLAIALGRHIRHGDHAIRTRPYRGWRPHFYGTGLHGSTVAVAGLGRVGAAIVDRLRGFGCARILGVDPTINHPGTERCSLDTALAQADFVFLAVPLDPDSIQLLDAGRLAGSKPGQFIVNIGRGSVVDESAVAAALDAGRLGGYAADVFACEDWGIPDRPAAIPVALLEAPNTVFTPHLGSAVGSVRLAIEHRAADNIIAALSGEVPPDRVVPKPAERAVRASS